MILVFKLCIIFQSTTFVINLNQVGLNLCLLQSSETFFKIYFLHFYVTFKFTICLKDQSERERERLTSSGIEQPSRRAHGAVMWPNEVIWSDDCLQIGLYTDMSDHQMLEFQESLFPHFCCLIHSLFSLIAVSYFKPNGFKLTGCFSPTSTQLWLVSRHRHVVFHTVMENTQSFCINGLFENTVAVHHEWQ